MIALLVYIVFDLQVPMFTVKHWYDKVTITYLSTHLAHMSSGSRCTVCPVPTIYLKSGTKSENKSSNKIFSYQEGHVL